MKKTDKSPTNKDSNVRTGFSRSDKLALIKDIHSMMDSFDYVSVKIFKESAERMASVYLRGRGLPVDPFGGLLGQLIQFSRRSKSPDAAWFSDWVAKVHQVDAERLSSRERKDELIDIAKTIYKKLTIEIDNFGYTSASGYGPEVYLGSLAGFYHIFPDSDSLRSFALSLINAATEIESSRTVIETMPLPDDYAEMALADWSEQIVANAWLYPYKEDNDRS